MVRTGHYTGRLPKDKFFVREPSSEKKIWWGKINRPIEQPKFEVLKHRLCAYLQGKDIFSNPKTHRKYPLPPIPCVRKH